MPDLKKELTTISSHDRILSMLQYTIGEIKGRQHKFVPNQAIEIDFQGDSDKDIEANVLFLVEDGKVKIGKPYLKEKMTLQRLENIKGKKVRVAKFHAKSNDRRVVGIRPKLTKVMLVVKRAS